MNVAAPRMLAVVSRFKWSHIDYLAALARNFELLVVWSREGHEGAAAQALREGMRGYSIGEIRGVGTTEVRKRLGDAISHWEPDVVHVMYYDHEELAVFVRDAIDDALLLFECRDPLTTLSVERGDPTAMTAGSPVWNLEHAALRASDAQIFVSEALRGYLERSHELGLSDDSMIVPHGFARSTMAKPSPKLSARDGRVHIALVGSARDDPSHSRWYVDIIRHLVSTGLVVHSHFFELEGISLEPYAALARELDDYHHHPTVPSRGSPRLSELMSRYDLMGVFQAFGAPGHDERPTQSICLPVKAVCGWFHGAIPVVCFPDHQGVVERIERLGIGFVIDRWADLTEIAADREAIARVTERCLAYRDSFTNEYNAERIRRFVEPRLAGARQDHLRGDLVERP